MDGFVEFGSIWESFSRGGKRRRIQKSLRSQRTAEAFYSHGLPEIGGLRP
jgi:hypothetical protein